MQRRKRTYRIATGFVALIVTASGGMAVTHAAPMMKALAHLGYPRYFSDWLGAGKLMGVAVLLAPGLGRLKEWAYVAFGGTVLSAGYSHFQLGDGLLALEPLVTFAALVVSYRTRPAERRYSVASRMILTGPSRPEGSKGASAA